MKVKVLLVVFGLTSILFASESPKAFYSRVEQHLRSLPTLEIDYHAEGLAFGDDGVIGHMYWLRPDLFLHETPEWIHCDTRTEQWRYLKKQNTLIRETPQGRSDWLPESILLDISVELEPRELETNDSGKTVLILDSESPTSPGQVHLSFHEGNEHPFEIKFNGKDGTTTVYHINKWSENVTIDTNRFIPPEVPAENLIDFRIRRGDN